jgi:catechol 2,3-dioxygenase-like lactoylglutathione lyase family enzyme
MLDHIGLGVSDLARSKAFYSAALAPLDIGIMMEMTADQTGGHSTVGFGARGKSFFWIGEGHVAGGLHVAFAVQDRAAVDAFYRAAIAAGSRNNGAPGLRPHYHPNYYATFVLDPDGHNIEAVCHTAE